MSEDTPQENNKPSQIPSWVMVGFVLGVLTMWGFQSSEDSEPAAAEATANATPETSTSGAPTENPLMQDGKPSIEMVQRLFSGLREWAFWTDDRTEIAVWNATTSGFTDHFEIIRGDDRDYFRAIPRFSRLPLEGYGPEHSPILFTETAEQRSQRYYQANPEKVPPAAPKPTPVEFKTLPRPPGGE